MTYFLPSFFQKRILRYALSRLELLETDDLALDKLDIAWGRRSTVELRDVGVRLKKLSTLLSLPPSLILLKARVSLLRLTVPADLYKSGIWVEVDGVEVHLKTKAVEKEKSGTPCTKSSSSLDGQHPICVKADRPRSTQPLVHDPGGLLQSQTSDIDHGDISSDDSTEYGKQIPSTTDLAKSFLQAEPQAEKDDLKAGISNSYSLGESPIVNEIDSDASAYGMGNALSLPNFLADFLRGVGDRLQTKVENVRVDLELNLDLPMGSSTGSSVGDGSEIVTIRLLIKEVDLKGATTSHPELDLFKSQPGARANINNEHVLPHIQYARPVILSHVQIMLLSDASVLASLSRFDAPSSPTAMQTSFAGPPGSETFENVSGPMSSSSSASLKIVESVIVQDNIQTTPTPTKLDTSIIASDSERFADAENEGRSPGLPTSAYASSLEGSRYQDSILTDSFYLDDEANELDRLQQKSPFDSRLSQNNIDASHDQQPHFSIQRSQHYNVPPNVTTFLEDTQDLAASSSSLMGNLGYRQEAIIDSQKATLLGHGLDKKEHDAQPLLERSSFVTGASAGYDDDSAYPRLEDLAQSKIFSREEAESMYMSAISHASLPNKDQDSMIPGSWGLTTHDHEDPIQDVVLSAEEGKPVSDHYSLSSRRSVSHLELGGGISSVQENERSSTRTKFLAHTVSPKSSASISAGEPGSNRGSRTEGQADVPAQDSENPSGRSDKSLLISKKFISIDCITMMIPQDSPQASQDENQDELKHSEPEYTSWQPTFSSLPKGADRCDAVSAPSDVNVPKTLRHGIADIPSQQQSLVSKEPKDPHHRQISIHISNLELLGDFGLARLTILAVQQSVMLHEPKVSHKETREGYYPFLNDLRLQVAKFSWKFLDSAKGFDTTSKSLDSPELETHSFSVAAEVLLKATVTEFDLLFRKNESSTYTKLSLGKLCFGYASEDFLSFDPELKMRESTRDILAPINNDVILTISQAQESSKIHLTTLPLRFSLDLRRLDETFSWFGGFSSILGLGSSMISTVTVVNTKSRSPISHRGVHFEAQRPSTTSSDQKCLYSQKFTARIGSIAATLQGANCTLRLDSTAMKIVSRAEGIGLQVDRLKFAGPFLRHDAGAPSITASLANIRIEYLSTPKEADLARLLALLSPSKDQYIHDDDILLDTLFRQRRQGGVIRITVESIQGYFSNLDHLQFLPDMAEELKKLSTVAKYLPEDDRPGILTLGLVHDLKCEITVDSKLGVFSTASEGLELAHVTLPSLTAIAMRRLVVSRNNIEELLGEAAPNNLRPARPPMIMARFVGDEMEPTVKIKLQNLRVEYHVSTLIALLELIHETDMEAVVSEMVPSIANITSRQQFEISPPGLMSETSAIADKNFETTKPTRLDIAIRDSMIGLNPRNSPAKGLVVLSNAQLQGSIPINGEASAVLEIRKASLMVIDDLDNIAVNDESTGEDTKGTQKDQIQDLLESGFVSVSYISSASASLNLSKTSSDEGTSLDVEIRDDLFVLESCADSTQTLQTIINGLKPPIPPSIDLKYRTEIVPVEDMLTSFSGDAYAMPQRSEGGNLEFPLREVDEGDMVDDEVPQNLEFVSSFYNPDPEGFHEGIADSILDDDLELLAGPPVTRRIGDRVLLESFQEQYQVTPGGGPLDFQEDHFATNSRVGGTAHRWDAKQNTYGLANDSKIRASPLRLRIRDVHIIWNLFDGYDWQNTRDVIGKAILEVESKASERFSQQSRRKSLDNEDEEESEIGDFLFNSIYIGVPANRDPKDLARQVNRKLDDLASETESYATSSASGSPSRQSQVPRVKGKKQRLTRSKYHKMTFELKGVSVDFVVFPPHTQEPQSSVDIRVQDLDIFDHVPSSTWKKFATYMHDAGERESGTSMIHIEILNVKPVPTLAASEIILKATILPLRLHVDQDALDFMIRFFEFKDDSTLSQTSESEAAFFQRVEVNSVRLKLDFKPKRVDYAGLRSGRTNEFMNFFILDRADMVLRHAIIYGVSGFDKLGKTLNDIWMPDIKHNQLPGVLAGLAPLRSLVNVGGGVRDLVVVPIREYRKDGRVVRSFQKGALAFAKTTTSELVKLGAKLAIGTQTVLQGAEDLLGQPRQQRSDLSAGWDEAEFEDDEKKRISLYADQPVGVIQGLRGAYVSLERDLLTTRDAIVAMPGEIIESGTAGGAARAVLRRAPTIILRPAMGVSKAVGQTLMGATNSLDPGNRKRIEDKYKRH